MIQIPLHSQCAGYFTVRTKKPGKPWRVQAQFPNLITDWGLNRMGDQADWMQACHVGTGSATPVVGDTTLQSRVETTGNLISETSGVETSSPRYAWAINVYEFAEGAAAGNLTEIAVGPSSGANYTYSRSLFKDAQGDPVTVTVTADERLQVTYEFRLYIPETDVTGSVDIGGTTHSYTARASRANDSSGNNGWGMGQITNGQGFSMNGSQETSYKQLRAYDGPIQGVTSFPSGSFTGAGEEISEPYVQDSLEAKVTGKWTAAQANYSPGIQSFFASMSTPAYQIEVDPVIAKTENDELEITFIHSWGRKA